MSDAWRLLVDAPADGAWNMAVDEILLDSVAAGAAPPTLRFYEWTPPCLSLGYFQPFDVVDLEGCRALGVDVVRRPTGGRAILHDCELTYSVALPASVLGHDGGVLPSYYRLSLALQDGLRRLGVPATLAPESAAGGPVHGPVCFDRPSPHEILLHGRKLVGSAQMRRGGGILQHGRILIEPRIDKLTACLRLPGGPGGIEAGVASLAEVGLTEPAPIAAAISDAFAGRFGISLVQAPLEPAELAAAMALASSKYQTASWTQGLTPAAAGKTTRTRWGGALQRRWQDGCRIWPLLARGFGHTLYVVPGAVCTTACWTCQALIHVRAKLHSAYAPHVPKEQTLATQEAPARIIRRWARRPSGRDATRARGAARSVRPFGPGAQAGPGPTRGCCQAGDCCAAAPA